ncbi:hypothetical protein DPMN_046276 [Dreissena polymorpha]|uniref:Uncharacterized protein n=1 Tax=Dreissena polymorpha TaxID=45954 RepID=A0A9D4D6H8_DREPO|nr:hypothetical protein DPMN_046276 [Dreissena polymorpha]
METQVKRYSITTYFRERCGGGSNSKDFWPTVEPFLSQKPTNKTDKLVDGQLKLDQNEVANTFYSNITNNIGMEDNTRDTDTH